MLSDVHVVVAEMPLAALDARLCRVSRTSLLSRVESCPWS
jgi:hypothetical protein